MTKAGSSMRAYKEDHQEKETMQKRAYVHTFADKVMEEVH
jgi:hypothetical protein